MMVLAMLLSLCSEADAFVAASFRTTVPLTTQMAFMVPLLFLTSVIGQGMGAHALTKKYKGVEQQTLTRLLESGKGNIGEANPTPNMSLLDIARQMEQMDGRRVITEGLVYRPEIMPDNYLTLFRFAIFCCTADALPVWVFVENAGVDAFEDENWIRVDGTVQIVNFNGTDVPVIKADTIEEKAPHPRASSICSSDGEDQKSSNKLNWRSSPWLSVLFFSGSQLSFFAWLFSNVFFLSPTCSTTSPLPLSMLKGTLNPSDVS